MGVNRDCIATDPISLFQFTVLDFPVALEDLLMHTTRVLMENGLLGVIKNTENTGFSLMIL